MNPISAAWNTAARYHDYAGVGALWGVIFGFAAHLATRGRRDFSSLRALSAGRYDLVVRQGDAERVRAMLSSAGLLPADPR
ncbi:MAG TPA: hypothetical protein VGM53_23095 [Streptosporangiaceae bacterium]